MYHDTTLVVLIEYLKLQLSAFVVHNFIAHWQEKELKQFMKHILEDIVVSCMYFS
jgi:hypothetical protein